MSSDRRTSLSRWLLLVVAVGSAQACADFSRGPETTEAGASTDAGTRADGGALSFAADVYPLLAICMNCHVGGGAAASSSLILAGHAGTDYPTVLKFVQTAAPTGSRLLSKVSGNGHGGGTIYAAGTTQYETILAWIQQGAPP